jgi:DNA-binding response OmpR family regulator
MAQILHAALEGAAFAVDLAETCNDAHEALSLIPYDAAVLDLGLPDGDGVLLLRDLRPEQIHDDRHSKSWRLSCGAGRWLGRFDLGVPR